MFLRFVLRCLLLVALLAAARAGALTLLHYNVAGNGVEDWSTNSPQVQSIGRQMRHWQPTVIAFNEIPYTHTWQMASFVAAYLPGYHLATNSGTDGYIRSAIVSRHPIVRSQKWLDGVSLVPFGYSTSPSTFTRDLFEAEIAVPGWSRPLHVFTTHLKAYANSPNSAPRRAAEAAAISNFFVTTFLPAYGNRPYVLTGDMNEDVLQPPANSGYPLTRLANGATGLRLTTPTNPVTGSERTISIRSSLSSRLDYILPCGLLFSNIAGSQIFRTDRLTPLPSGLLTGDSATASDHLPVLMSFHNPYDTVFRLTSVTSSNRFLRLSWQTTTGRVYRVELTTNLVNWNAASLNLYANSSNLTWTAERTAPATQYRIYRLP